MNDNPDKPWAKKIDRGTTMAEMWEGFAEGVIPFAQKDSIQYREMQKSFYSGALCLFNWFMVQMDESTDEPTEGDLDLVSAISDEIEQFFVDLLTGPVPW